MFRHRRTWCTPEYVHGARRTTPWSTESILLLCPVTWLLFNLQAEPIFFSIHSPLLSISNRIHQCIGLQGPERTDEKSLTSHPGY